LIEPKQLNKGYHCGKTMVNHGKTAGMETSSLLPQRDCVTCYVSW